MCGGRIWASPCVDFKANKSICIFSASSLQVWKSGSFLKSLCKCTLCGFRRVSLYLATAWRGYMYYSIHGFVAYASLHRWIFCSSLTALLFKHQIQHSSVYPPTLRSAVPPSLLHRKGPKCYFNSSFHRSSPSAVCPQSGTANLHMGLCLRSPAEESLADKAPGLDGDMHYWWREGDLLLEGNM